MEPPKTWSIRDRAIAWANLAALFVLALGVAVLANFNGERFPRRWDMTESKSYSITDMTRQLIQYRVQRKLYVYIVGVQFSQDQSIYAAMDLLSRLLGEFKRLNPKFVELVPVPPKGDEEERRRLEMMFGARLSEGHVYLATFRRVTAEGLEEDPSVETLPLADMYLGDPTTGKVLEFRGEEMLANAINKMFTDRPHVIYVTRGHGELPREQTPGDVSFHMIAQVLEQRLHIDWRDLDAPISAVPSDAEVLLIPRPLGDFSEMELGAVYRYVEGGGRVLIAASRESSLTKSLRELDIHLTGKVLLADTPGRIEMWIQMMGHETNGLKSMQARPETVWVDMTEVRSVSREEKKRPLFSVIETIQTADLAKPFDYATVSSTPNLQAIPFGFGQGEKMPVAVVGEGPVVQGAPDARVVVWGTHWGLVNPRGDPYQYQLVMNTLNWLWGREDMITASPTSSTQAPLFLEPDQSTRILFITALAMPMVALLFGVGLWIVRRR